MIWPLILLLCVVNVWLMGLGLVRRGGIYEVPFLAGSVFMGFILPQLPALENGLGQPSFAVERMILFTTACALMTGIGWLAGQRPLRSGVHVIICERHLLYLSLVLSLAGAYFYYKVSRLPPEVRLVSMPSGIMVLYSFFQRMLTCGFVIAILCIARRPSPMAWSIMLFDLILLGDRLLMGGRKGEATEALLAVLISFWFYRRWTVPRILALSGVLLAAISLNSTSDYREIVRGENRVDWDQISKISVIENFVRVLKEGGPETRNAVKRMDIVANNEAFDYGLFHWNIVIHDFVPAQLLGRVFKDSLTVDLSDQYGRDYDPDLGSTETGMSDAFASFWYLGAIKFFIISYVLARIYCTARQGWVLAQILYIFGITAAMLSVSHHTEWLLSTYITLAIILLPALFLLPKRYPRVAEIGVSAS